MMLSSERRNGPRALSKKTGGLRPVTWSTTLAAGALLVGFTAEPSAPRAEAANRSALAVAPRLPDALNDRVEIWLDRFQSKQRRTFEAYLEREGLYAELIRDRLRERGMPEDLLYLAMMESGFVPGATSHAAAVGVWQFMRPTAEAHGLRIDAWVDERRDPVRATEAALDYLEALHDRFGSWYLAAAAYNAGPTRVAAILRRHGTSPGGDEQLYWDIIDRLPRETREYVPKILAARILASDPGRFGFAADRMEPYRFDQVLVPGRTALRDVADVLGVPPQELYDLNPHLVRRVTPPREAHSVRVPVGSGAAVVLGLTERRSQTRDAAWTAD